MGLIFNGNGDVIKAVDGSLTVEGLDLDSSSTNINAGIVTGTSANFTGNVSVGGVLTYEDVKNVDSVGVVTARAGIVVQGDSTFTGNSHNGYWEKSNSRFKLSDGGKVVFGDGADLQLHHTSNNSHIEQAGTGQLYFDGNAGGSTAFTFRPDKNEVAARMFSGGSVELYHNNAKKLETSSYGTWLGDNSRITLGGSAGTPDCHFYADGTDTNLQNITGDLIIKSNSGGDKAIVIKNGAATEIYHDNVKKLETTSTGVTISSGNLVLGDNQQIQFGANDLRIYHSSSAGDSYIEGTSRDIIIKTTSANFIAFQTNNSTRLNITSGGVIEVHDSVALSANAPSVKGKIRISGPSDSSNAGGLEFHTSSGGGGGYGSRITSDATGDMHFHTRNNHSGWSERFRIDYAGNVNLGKGGMTSGAYGRQIQIHDTGTTGAALHLTTNDTGSGNSDGIHLVQQGPHFYHWLREAGNMVFATNNSEKFRINSDGTHTLNHPIVFAYAPATTQSLTDATWTKNTWLTSEDIDTDNAFSSSRFTVPSGKGGKYFIAVGNNLYGNDNNIRNARTAIYKNGSLYSRSYNVVFSTSSSGLRHFTAEQQCVATLAAGDYIENYMICDVNSGLVYLSSDSWGVRGNYMLIYRIG